jgi:succinate dehydrogenase subunit C
MAPMILVHLGVIFYAMRMRLTAADILSRTQGSIGWTVFYGTFVVLASIHAAIGCRTVLREWGGLRGLAGNAVAAMIGLILLGLGLRAVAAVVLP